MEAIFYSFLIANILFFMYETDFFVQYIKLFKLSKVFGVNKYEEHLQSMSDDSYWEWLAFEKQTFLSKLISCPFCFGFWVNVGVFFLYKDWGIFVLVLWFSLFLYLLLKILSRKAYE
jgi:hypothetical protein